MNTHICLCTIPLNTQTPPLQSTHSWAFLFITHPARMSDTFMDMFWTQKHTHRDTYSTLNAHPPKHIHSLTSTTWKADSLATLINVNHCRLASLSRLRQCLSEKEGEMEQNRQEKRNTDRLGGEERRKCKMWNGIQKYTLPMERWTYCSFDVLYLVFQGLFFGSVWLNLSGRWWLGQAHTDRV